MTIFAVKVLRTVSIGLCLLATLSFLMFALNQTSTASGRQQESLAGQKTAQKHTHESGFRKTVDEITEKATAPVSGLSSSQWGEHALRLIFALLVFGFALGFVARVLRVRA